jgi:hypothetical protein
MNTTPIVVFAYRRPRHLKRVLDALARNPVATQSPLFIYCDGAKRAAHLDDVAATRLVARSAAGFASIEIIERKSNLGLSNSIVAGVNEVCERFGRVIVLEDDVLPTPFFLQYCNEALDKYSDDERILSIGCHTFTSDKALPETFFLNVPDCWGWGVWDRSWRQFNPNGGALLSDITDRGLADQFDFDGVYPYTQMLREQVRGGNQSWAVRWYAQAFLNKKLVLYPGRAVTQNIGFDGTGTHGGTSKGYQRVRTAEHPISVEEIEIAESKVGRESWKHVLREMSAGGRQGLSTRIRRRLGDVSWPIRSYLAKARTK